MNKKIIIFVGLLIAIILVGTSIYYISTMQKYKTCEQINEELYNYILAIKNQDITYCGNTGNPDFCVAHVKKDISFCDTYPDKNYCLAIITSNEALCPAEDWWCKADASKNPTYCDKMNEKEKQQCKAEIALNEKYFQGNLC